MIFDQDLAKIQALGRVKFSYLQIFEYLKKLPQISVAPLFKELGLSAPTVTSAINHLVGLDMLKEISHKQRDRVYVYKRYLDLLSEGSAPL